MLREHVRRQVRAIGDIPGGQEVSVSVMRDKKPLTITVKLPIARATWHVQQHSLRPAAFGLRP